MLNVTKSETLDTTLYIIRAPGTMNLEITDIVDEEEYMDNFWQLTGC